MLTVYRYIKNCLAISIVASLAWFGANSFAQNQDQQLEVPPVDQLEGQPKLLSEMTEAEKAALSKEERASLEELEEKLEKMKEAEAPQY